MHDMSSSANKQVIRKTNIDSRGYGCWWDGQEAHGSGLESLWPIYYMPIYLLRLFGSKFVGTSWQNAYVLTIWYSFVFVELCKEIGEARSSVTGSLW